MRRMIIAAMSLGLTVGCAIAEEDFPDAYGSAVCSQLKSCDRGDYEERWDDKADCVDDWADGADILLDAADLFGQTYNPDRGRDCVTNVRRATCEEFDDGEVDCDLFADD